MIRPCISLAVYRSAIDKNRWTSFCTVTRWEKIVARTGIILAGNSGHGFPLSTGGSRLSSPEKYTVCRLLALLCRQTRMPLQQGVLHTAWSAKDGTPPDQCLKPEDHPSYKPEAACCPVDRSGTCHQRILAAAQPLHEQPLLCRLWTGLQALDPRMRDNLLRPDHEKPDPVLCK